MLSESEIRDSTDLVKEEKVAEMRLDNWNDIVVLVAGSGRVRHLNIIVCRSFIKARREVYAARGIATSLGWYSVKASSYRNIFSSRGVAARYRGTFVDH